MAQLAHAGSAIMDEFNSAFSQCMPSPGLTMKSDSLAGGGYTPSLLTAPLHPAPPPAHAAATACAAPLGTAKPSRAGKPGVCFIKMLGWLGVAMAGVIIVAVFLRRRMLASNEPNVMPLITDSLYVVPPDPPLAPPAPRVVEVVEDNEAEEEDLPQASGAPPPRRVRFDDEEHVAPAPAPAPSGAPAPAAGEPPGPEEEEEDAGGGGEEEDPNFTPMKLDMM